VKIDLLVVVLMLSNSQAKAIEHFSVKINNRNGNVNIADVLGALSL
jgi:hypothetical protein